MFVKMPRNPINGEKTSREDADFAVPFHHSLMLKLEAQKMAPREPVPVLKLTRYVDERETTFARADPLVEQVKQRIETTIQPNLQTLRERRSAIDNEIYQMRRVAEFKNEMLIKAQLASGKPMPLF